MTATPPASPKQLPPRRGILLAGGSNTRLYPVTFAVPKTLLPVYDKPILYYTIAMLMFADIREILVITAAGQSGMFKKLLGDGSNLGVAIDYIEQPEPKGIAQAMILGEKFLDGHRSALILGDNIYYGAQLAETIAKSSRIPEGAGIFAARTLNPEQFGIVELDEQHKIVSLVEKPTQPRSNLAITGFYLYDSQAPELAARLKPSGRGELEITDLNKAYHELGKLHATVLGRGTAWFDTGTADSLAEASEFVRAVQRGQGTMICCPEEIAWRKGWIDDRELESIAGRIKNTNYAAYLRSLPAGNRPVAVKA